MVPGDRCLRDRCRDYKEHWHHVLAERARNGTTGPEPVTHPDDVIIDYKTGHVQIDGPVLEEQKAAWEQLLARSPELERNLMQINEQISPIRKIQAYASKRKN